MKLAILSLTQAVHLETPSNFKFGTQYGNRFLPEVWMMTDEDSIYGTKYGPKVTHPDDIEKASLCDVTDDRILKFLDDQIKEKHFK